MCRSVVITFLENYESLMYVDSVFRKLVEFFHRIPFCATFGVSCAGDFEETDDTDKFYPNSFDPSPWGSLDIIILPTIPHIQELLDVLRKTVGNYSDTSFKKIDHPFGPPEDSCLEIWEIRIGDNGCLASLKEEYCGGFLSIKEYQIAYEESKKRCKEIRLFWRGLEMEVADFCRRHVFERFDLKKRIEELVGVWKEDLKK